LNVLNDLNKLRFFGARAIEHLNLELLNWLLLLLEVSHGDHDGSFERCAGASDND